MSDVAEPSLSQASEIASVLDSRGIDYWLDSGTLLGVIREGRLLPSDHDVDLSFWWDGAIDFGRLHRDLVGLGYTIRPGIYRGQLFKFWLIPTGNRPGDTRRNVDIRFFRPWRGAFAWSPRVERRDLLPGLSGFPKQAAELGYNSVWWAWKYLARGAAPAPLRRHLARIVDIHCWWIPARFFEDRTVLANGLRVPSAYEEYLGYRYGDWRVPQPDWQFEHQDPTYLKLAPEELFARHERPPGTAAGPAPTGAP